MLATPTSLQRTTYSVTVSIVLVVERWLNEMIAALLWWREIPNEFRSFLLLERKIDAEELEGEALILRKSVGEPRILTVSTGDPPGTD